MLYKLEYIFHCRRSFKNTECNVRKNWYVLVNNFANIFYLVQLYSSFINSSIYSYFSEISAIKHQLVSLGVLRPKIVAQKFEHTSSSGAVETSVPATTPVVDEADRQEEMKEVDAELMV